MMGAICSRGCEGERSRVEPDRHQRARRAGGAVTPICGTLAVETAARCGCARDAYTANPACDTPDGITLSWNGREGCGVLVIGYL